MDFDAFVEVLRERLSLVCVPLGDTGPGREGTFFRSGCACGIVAVWGGGGRVCEGKSWVYGADGSVKGAGVVVRRCSC